MLQCSISGIMEYNPVPVFAALAHPQRLAVVRLLMRQYPQTVSAGEISLQLGVKPSTLSGYFAQLVEADLITQTRVGTSLLYAASETGIQALNHEWISNVCRGRGLPDIGTTGTRIRNCVFVGPQNTGATLIAEALLRAKAGARYEVFSAGIEAAGGDEQSVLDTLENAGFDVEPLWVKPLSDLVGPGAPRMDVVITIGDGVLERLPGFNGCPIQAHWTIPDGMSCGQILDWLSARLTAFAALDPAKEPRSDLQSALDHAPDDGSDASDQTAIRLAAQANDPTRINA